jgi:two-component system NarL family sensor kinase
VPVAVIGQAAGGRVRTSPSRLVQVWIVAALLIGWLSQWVWWIPLLTVPIALAARAGERRRFTELGRQNAVALEPTTRAPDPQRAREQLVFAREEERRRLGGDLRDGIEPSLVGMRTRVRTARRLVLDGGPMGDQLDQLEADLVTCGRRVRGLADQLHPAALNSGLLSALRAETARCRSAALAVELDCPTIVDGLPAAVEVAAYQIVHEALANVARPGAVRVVLRVADQLELAIVDDGGLTPTVHDEVSLASMRMRAEELGGACTVDAGTTTLMVRLPVADRPHEMV